MTPRHIRSRALLWRRLNETYYPARAYRSVAEAAEELSTAEERKFAADVERWLQAWEDTR